MKVLYAASEALPFAASGGLADVAGSLPRALRRRGTSCRAIIPLYGSVSDEARANMKFITNVTVPVAWRRQYCGIFKANAGGVVYYLLDNEYYFKRDNLYGYYDDAERFAFFSRAVLEVIPHIDFKPDIIHCNDWQTALIPVYYTTVYGSRGDYAGIKTVFTIHNVQYQGQYGEETLGDVFGLGKECEDVLRFGESFNLMKGGLERADAVTTVSKTYAEELLDPWFSGGLDPVLRRVSYKLSGILNGIDLEIYNPETDKNIFCNYSAKKPEGKEKNKSGLQNLFSLPERADVPLIGIVSRLAEHKGFDLIERVARDFVASTDVQLVVLGSGDAKYESFFRELASAFPEKVGLRLGFVPDLARKIYAGSDMFLMPSKSEPCGISQTISLRYGSIPIVRETGGLKDVVTDSGDGKGVGFTFKSYDAFDMLDAVRRALAAYADAGYWKTLVARALAQDNGWGRSAKEYIKLYKSLM